MNIAQVAELSGLTPRMIRHYEKLGVVPTPERTDGNYRDYGDDDLERLRIVAAARAAGFGMSDLASIVALWSGAPTDDRAATVASWMTVVAARQRALDDVRGALTKMMRS